MKNVPSNIGDGLGVEIVRISTHKKSSNYPSSNTVTKSTTLATCGDEAKEGSNDHVFQPPYEEYKKNT